MRHHSRSHPHGAATIPHRPPQSPSLYHNLGPSSTIPDRPLPLYDILGCARLSPPYSEPICFTLEQ